MFELNTLLLRNFGWKEKNTFKDVLVPKEINHQEIIYFYMESDIKMFLITRHIDKQKSITGYNFIVHVNKKQIHEFDLTFQIKSNLDLIRLIRDFEACDTEYKRHFKINKIFK